MARNRLSEGTQAILDEFAKKRGLSKRAIAEMRSSLAEVNVGAEGSNQWVNTLSTGVASQHQLRPSHGKLKVPRPSARMAPFFQPPPPCRRPQHSIAQQTNNYEREQYHRSEIIKDACAQRIEDQLIFEYGKEGMKEMKRMQVEHAQRCAVSENENITEDNPQAIRNALVDQIFREIEERLQFQQEMEGARGAKESCRVVRLEVAQRVSELARLGVDVSAARPATPTGPGPLPSGQQHGTT